jgi:hypothetical protein
MTTDSKKEYKRAIINAQLEPGSLAQETYRQWVAGTEALPAARNAAFNADDLVRRGGRIIPQSQFRNIYLGDDDLWHGDREVIDASIEAALQDRRLENVMRQYFDKPISCERGPSILLTTWKPQPIFTTGDTEALILDLFDKGTIKDDGLPDTLFNIVLPRGVVLTDDDQQSVNDLNALNKASSLFGLGGFHGSVNHKSKKRIYYSVNVFSERDKDGRRNGILAFPKSWQNVVATLYHEINEFRTDPDVAEANRNLAHASEILGWLSTNREEIGDHPMSSKPLGEVMREILLTNGQAKVPVQLMYSNAIHDAQGPVEFVPNATKRQGHGVGLRGLDTAAEKNAVNPAHARFGKIFALAGRPDVPPFPEDLGLPGGPMDGGVGHQNNDHLPAVLTYFGQFLDHDITFDPTSSLERQVDPEAIENFRTPALDLDSLYGAGPATSPFLYDRLQQPKMLIGAASDNPALVDLPRNSQGVALLGDPRNDENLIVSQFHVAVLKFHNAIVDRLGTLDDGISDESPFEKAQRLVRWHYQWLVLNEFLPKICGEDAVTDILKNGRKVYTPQQDPFIPVEFSVRV